MDTARSGQVGRATRMVAGRPTYLVAVPVEAGRVVRLAVPLADNLATQRRMRTRLLVGAGVGFVAVVLLSWLVIRRLVRPLQAMTETAEQLARGDYAARPPAAAAAAAGEVGVLAHALTHLAGEVQARFAEVQGERRTDGDHFVHQHFPCRIGPVDTFAQPRDQAVAFAAADNLLGCERQRLGHAGDQRAGEVCGRDLVDQPIRYRRRQRVVAFVGIAGKCMGIGGVE